jgi:spore coat polysaccharide biosynthesis protein SpsF
MMANPGTRKKVVASIEARMGSSRLPGKVLMDLCGKPVIGWLVDRLRACRTLDEIVVATSTAAGDDLLAAWCADNGVNCFRGSEEDVLNRVVETHRAVASDIVVEITGDCPLTDPDVVDLGVETFLFNDCDYLTNCEVPSYPQGICVQVFRFADLERMERESDDPAVREHVSPLFYERKDIYRNVNLLAPGCWHLPPDCRTQLDYPEDLRFLHEVCSRLVPKYGMDFRMHHLVELLRKEPHLMDINRHCEERTVR